MSRTAPSSDPQTRELAGGAVQAILRRFDTYARCRPRAADEAELLRALGTPEHLIGPVRPASEPGEREG